ncbi:uncharacterized protein LOC143301194 isoform X3 [Babylonia areolata]|uniref:uncharacterized protein LOC143301194 isoform X3 n=1 Tax=Babylonia areolata TaxID=304850 RepID=UPI003FD31B52
MNVTSVTWLRGKRQVVKKTSFLPSGKMQCSRGMLVVLVALVLALWCQQGQALYTYSCDGQLMTLHCPPRQVLHVRSAMFGKKPGTHQRCGETTRIHRACETDITQFMKYKCDGLDYCQIMVEMATFSLETFCPDFIKYAEVVFDCIPPQRMQGVRSCLERCLPPPVPSFGRRRNPSSVYSAHAMPPSSFSGSNAVVPTSAPSQAGVVYTHQGGSPVHAPPASASASAPSSPPAGGAAGAGPAAEPKGFGSPPVPPQPGAAAPSAGLSQRVMSVVRSHLRSAKNAPTASGHAQSGSPQTSVPRDLMAKIGQMIGAMRRGKLG